MVNEEVEEEEVKERDNDDYQDCLFLDIESLQDDDRHMLGNLLIVQDETGFETK